MPVDDAELTGLGLDQGGAAFHPVAAVVVDDLAGTDAFEEIHPEDRERIFDRFERAAPTGRYGGLGLGLYITRRVVDAHGGKIWAESVEGRGSEFIFIVPRS